MITTLLSVAQLRAIAASLAVGEVYGFLCARYKRDRFEGRDNDIWGRDYSACVAQSASDDLKRHGFALISKHESATGCAVYYDATLNEIDGASWDSLVRESRPSCYHSSNFRHATKKSRREHV